MLVDKKWYEEAYNSVSGATQKFVAGKCGDYFCDEKMYDKAITYYLKSDRSF